MLFVKFADLCVSAMKKRGYFRNVDYDSIKLIIEPLKYTVLKTLETLCFRYEGKIEYDYKKDE